MACLRLAGNNAYNVFKFSRKKIVQCFPRERSSSLELPSIRRISFSSKNHGSAYDGDGKTVAFVLNKKDSMVLTIESCNIDGFILSSGLELVGSTIIFPHSLFSWHVKNASEVNEESLTLFKILDPKLDILLFGFGAPQDYTPEVREKFTKFCKKLDLRFEALPTAQAIGLYNFLACDMRFVAAALIPPTYVSLNIEKRKHLDISELEEGEFDLEAEEKLQTLPGQSKLIK